MKKKAILIIVVLLLLYGTYLLYKHSIKEYKLSYKISKYKVEEHYYKTTNHEYDIKIEKNKKIYTYTLENNFNKKKKIIKDIKTVKKDNISCIIPLYRKEIDLDVYCLLDNKQVSIDYLKKANNESFKSIQNKIKKYKIKYPSSTDTKETYQKVTTYNNNIEDNQIYYIWDYKGIYIIEKDNNNYQEILSYDLYDNIMSCIVNGNYLLWENTSVKGIDTVYYYNHKNKKLKKIKLEKPISKDSYINGVINNKIYITDRKKKREYVFDMNTLKLTPIDSDGTKYISYLNNKKKEYSKSDFFMNDQLFIKQEHNSKIDKDGWVSNRNFYYQEENKIVKVQNNNTVLLLELNNIKEWQIVGVEIILLREDTIYAYNEKKGLRKIVEEKELNYNYENIYKIGEK